MREDGVNFNQDIQRAPHTQLVYAQDAQVTTGTDAPVVSLNVLCITSYAVHSLVVYRCKPKKNKLKLSFF